MNDYTTPITLLRDDSNPATLGYPAGSEPPDFAIGAFQEVVRLRSPNSQWEYVQHRTLRVWLHHVGDYTIGLNSSGIRCGDGPAHQYWVTIGSGHGALVRLQEFSTLDATEAMEAYVALASSILQRTFVPAQHPDVALVDGEEQP